MSHLDGTAFSNLFQNFSQLPKTNEFYQSKEWEKIQYVGKDGQRKVDHPKLPLTASGFYVYCMDEGLGNVEQYFTNPNNIYDDFISICSRIKKEIRTDQITGGMLGFYNPSITQRLNNLTEKVESTTLDLSRVPEWMKKKDS